MNLPQRQSLAVETEKVIQAMIRSGEIKHRLPGERELAARLQVGRDTLRAALVELEKNGWISEGRHGKRRSILKTRGKRTGHTGRRRVGFLSPKRLEELPPAMLVEFNQVSEMLWRKGISLEIHAPSIFNLKQPADRLKDLVSSYNYDLWVLYQSNSHVQQWFASEKNPCLVRGQVYAGVELPSLDQDWRAIGYHAGVNLITAGHRSIGLMIPDTSLRGLHAVQDGVEDAVSKSAHSVKLHLMIEKGTAESVALQLRKALKTKTPPTGLLANRSRHVLSICSWLATQRLCIPQDVSLISLTHDHILEALLPKMAHYRLNITTMARSLVRKVEAVLDGQGQGEKLLIPDFIPGESVRKM